MPLDLRFLLIGLLDPAGRFYRITTGPVEVPVEVATLRDDSGA